MQEEEKTRTCKKTGNQIKRKEGNNRQNMSQIRGFLPVYAVYLWKNKVSHKQSDQNVASANV